MTDKERREDDVLKNCIQEAYGISDEQLLAELDEIEATLSDDEFVGVEDRIYEKIVEKEGITFSHELTPTKTVFTGKFSKRKKWLIIGLAATFVVGVGINTIGSNNYFLRRDENKIGIVLDSGKNIIETGDLEDAYRIAESNLEIQLIKMNYLPTRMIFEELQILEGNAVFVFSYNEEKVYLVQSQKGNEISMGINSDRNSDGTAVINVWLDMQLYINENQLNNNKTEYSMLIYEEEACYRIMGVLPKEEMIEIVKNLSF